MSARLLFDVTKLFQARFATGIQRVVRELLRRRDIIGCVLGMEIVAVVASDRRYYRLGSSQLDALLNPAELRTANVVVQSSIQKKLKRLLSASPALYSAIQRREIGRQMRRLTADLPMEPVNEADVVILADYIGAGSTSVRAISTASERAAASIAVIYDIIPLLHPEVVPPTTIHPFRWAFDRTVPVVDGLITIARSTAAEIREQPLVRRHKLAVESFYLGHDLAGDVIDQQPATIPANAWSGGPTFAMIGTIEPRKRQALVVEVFTRLWREGLKANLVLIGSIGWQVEAFLEQAGQHPEYGRSLFLCHQVGDAEMRAAVVRADATIMASTAEGFGLPVVESLALGTPVIASDIPVFREIAGGAGCYFTPDDVDAAKQALRTFIADQQHYEAAARAFEWIDWNGSAVQFADAVKRILAVKATAGVVA